MPLSVQVARLLMTAVPVACVAWTITHEELFKEPREWCERRREACATLAARKFFYLFTCEYCFSHYVAAAAIWATGFTLLVAGLTGTILAWLSVVWFANIYMSLFARLRLGIKRERVEVAAEEREGSTLLGA